MASSSELKSSPFISHFGRTWFLCHCYGFCSACLSWLDLRNDTEADHPNRIRTDGVKISWIRLGRVVNVYVWRESHSCEESHTEVRSQSYGAQTASFFY